MPDKTPSPEPWRTIRWLALLAALVGLAWLGLHAADRFTGGATARLSQGLDKVLGAITSSSTRIVEGRAEIASQSKVSELALMDLRMSATRTFESENYVLKYLSAGTKRLIIRGEYRVTAGYKLVPGVSLRIVDGVPVANFPKPTILGVELIDFQVLGEKDGWANSVTAEDRAEALRDLRTQMRGEAIHSGILDLVDSSLRTRLKDLLAVPDVKVEHDPAPQRHDTTTTPAVAPALSSAR